MGDSNGKVMMPEVWQVQWILGLPRQGRLGWERAPVSSGYGMPIHGLADQFFGYLSMFIFSSILFLFRPV
ncbi:hypothetical protein AAZX31_08G166300 [Glycine max]